MEISELRRGQEMNSRRNDEDRDSQINLIKKELDLLRRENQVRIIACCTGQIFSTIQIFLVHFSNNFNRFQ